MSANAVALSKCIKRPCIVYEEKLNRKEIEETKLYEVIDDVKKTKTVPMFDGSTDIEGLLYTEERYRKVARQLQFFTSKHGDNRDSKVSSVAFCHPVDHAWGKTSVQSDSRY